MTQRTDGGRIVPFPMTAAYVRRKAQENRREGRLVEACELFRKGSEMEGGEDCLLDLARVLWDMGCPEQAARALERLIIRQPGNACAYYELALAHARLGRRDAACDCAANCLALTPDSPLAEEARELMEHLAQPDEIPPSNRQGVLIRRGTAYQRQGQPEKARRAFERALRASRKAPSMRCALGMLYLEQGEPAKALKQAEKALRQYPDHLAAQSLQSLTRAADGDREAAAAVLDQMSRNPGAQSCFSLLCRTARQACGEAKALSLIEEQLRRQPCSIPLMEEAALSHWRLGQVFPAMRLWQQILRIDPANDSAKVCLGMAEAGCHEPPREAGMIPQAEMMARLRVLTVALSGGPEGFERFEAETPRSEDVIRWAFTLPVCGIHGPLLAALKTAWPFERVQNLLRPLLLDHAVAEEVRRQIVYHLIASGHQSPLLMLYGCHITQVEAQPAAGTPNLWKRFLHAYLPECCDMPDAREAVAFAARCWKAMRPDQRQQAVGEKAYAWVMAVKLLCLETGGFIELENEMAAHLPISVRRVERLMDLIERLLALKEAPTNEADRL